jgi:hypothetical protein
MPRFRSECLRSCTDVCKQKIEQLQTECGGCQEPRFANFMTDAGRKLVKCGLGSDDGTGQGSRCRKLDTVLNTACCAGADGVMGNADDTCQIPWTMPTTCHTDGTGLCAAAVQSGGVQCPELYVNDAGRLGLYADCGGQLNQLLASTSVESKTAHYCDDNPPPALTPDANRALQDTTTPSPEQRVEEMFEESRERQPEETRKHPSEQGLRQTMVTSAPHRAPTADTPQRAQRRALQVGSQSEACQQAYQSAFAATLPGNGGVGGVCSGASCTQHCQTLIHTMLEACKGQTFQDPLATVDTEYSFNQKAVAALAINGPRDCHYSMSYESCDELCSPVGILDLLNNEPGVYTECAKFFMGVDFHSWNGCTDAGGHPVSDVVKDRCWSRYTQVVQKCSGCSDPFVENVIFKLSKAVAQDECDTCAHPQETANKIREVCCAGADGILNTGDDPCTEVVQCVDHRRADCTANGGKPRPPPMPQCTNGTVSVDSVAGGPCTGMPMEHTGRHFRPAVPPRCQVSRYNSSVAPGGVTNAQDCEKTGHTFTAATNTSAAQCSHDVWTSGDAHNRRDCEETGHVFVQGAPARCTAHGRINTQPNGQYDHTMPCNAPDCWPASPKGEEPGTPGYRSAQDVCEQTYRMPSCDVSQEFSSVHWYNPETCSSVYRPNTACKAYVSELALSGKGCTSTFLESVPARRVFGDCGGDIMGPQGLVAKGRPCGPEVFTSEYGGDLTRPPATTNPHARASWGSCMNSTGYLVELKSGQSCNMRCQSSFCIDGNQPQCIDGRLNWGGSGQQMVCKVQPIVSCDFPPNGGCDPLTTCNDTAPGLFNLKKVTCAPCPPGYYGTGHSGCHDVNECLMRANGGCDEHTTCANTDGGYTCSDCPSGMSGDPYRVGGCCPDGTRFTFSEATGSQCVAEAVPEPEPEPIVAERCRAADFDTRTADLVSACCPATAECPPTRCDHPCHHALDVFVKSCAGMLATADDQVKQQVAALQTLCDDSAGMLLH